VTHVSRTTSSTPRAFTLMEMILVMVLLSVMMAIAVPSIRGFASGSRSRDVVVQLVATAQWAKATAASDARIVRLNIAPTSFVLTAQQGTAYERVLGEFGEVVELPPGAKIEVLPVAGARGVDPTGISFHPDGRTDPGILRVVGQDGRVTLVGCPSPAESFRVVSAEEASRL
jgi:prepilin-type N-terminal cleavage/methylation domain-containing protein